MIEQDRLRALLRVTKYSHATTPDGERRRLKWLRTDLALQLQAYHASRKHNLHMEIWHQVADYLAGDILQYYATAKARAALSEHSRLPTKGSIATTEKIWCSFTEYEGDRYVSCLSNSPGGNGSVLLTFDDRDQAPQRLLVAENHLGITKVSLAGFCDGNALDESPGTWWRTIRLGRTGRKVDVESDVRRTRTSLGCIIRGSLLVQGIKLRRLVCGSLGIIAWSVPEPEMPRVHCFAHCHPHRPPPRMASFRPNHPDATGYSFVWDSSLIHIHTRVAGEDMAFYRSFPHGSHLYMPVDRGEFITEIWQRK